MSGFGPFEAKLRGDAQPTAAIEAFRRHYTQLQRGETGLMPEAELTPVDHLEDAAGLTEADDAAGRAALNSAVIIKLNGGLGTSMGLAGPKALIAVRGARTFLDLVAEQAIASGCPLLLMNSFATRAPSLEHLARYPALSVSDFIQHRVPKVDRASLAPADHPSAPHLTWCPPGHGDLYTALNTRGVLDDLLKAGRRYAFVSNVDNLGATLDPKLLGHFVRSGMPFMLEAADRSEADRKGGHLAMRRGRMVLREAAQCPEADRQAFEDHRRHRYFNTNSLWLDLEAVATALAEHGGSLPLPLIRNRKTLDPRDLDSTPVYQLESAMGAAIAHFEGAGALRVPRSRFIPVKTTSDLLVVRSDAYTLSDDARLTLAASVASPPLVSLSADYRLVAALDAACPEGPPSLRGCERLTIEGLVRFGPDVVVTGDAQIIGAATPAQIPGGTYISDHWRP